MSKEMWLISIAENYYCSVETYKFEGTEKEAKDHLWEIFESAKKKAKDNIHNAYDKIDTEYNTKDDLRCEAGSFYADYYVDANERTVTFRAEKYQNLKTYDFSDVLTIY